MLLSKI